MVGNVFVTDHLKCLYYLHDGSAAGTAPMSICLHLYGRHINNIKISNGLLQIQTNLNQIKLTADLLTFNVHRSAANLI